MDDRDDIETLSRRCMRGFDELIASLSSCPEEFKKPMLERTIGNNFARFKIWCGNLGALQRGSSSLDVRLRGSIVMHDTVMRFLSQLKESLGQSIEITTGLRTPWEELEGLPEYPPKVVEVTESDSEDDDSEGSDSSDVGNSELTEKQSEIEDTITHLYRLSFKMRNANYRSTSTRALSTRIVDPETGEDLFSRFALFDRQHVLESLQQLRRVSEPISSGLPMARRVDNDVPVFLLERLSRAMTNRRRYFAYWQKHALKLSRTTDESLFAQGNLAASGEPRFEGLGTRSVGEADEQMKLKAEKMRFPGPETVISGTDISKYRDNPDDHLETDTVISYVTTAKDVNRKSADLPPPPANVSSKHEFMCPYCKVGCPSWQGKGKSWRAHILQDLQPYVCTIADCSDGDNLYATRGAWIEHERVCHRRVWRCFDQEHKHVLYESKDQLHLHLSNNHTDLGELQIRSFLGLAETTIADDRGVCPFCNSSGPFDKGLYNHMAFHQESIATFAAPRNVDEDGNDDTNAGNAQGTRSTKSLDLVSLDFSSNSKGGAKVHDEGDGDELYVASLDGHEQVVRLLLEAGADVNAQSGQYESALQAAAYNGHQQVVRLLLDMGAEINVQGGQNGNALQAAASNGHKQVVRLLLNAGAEINAQSINRNALQAAASNGHEQVVRLLLKKGADLDGALKLAACNGHEQVVKLLLEKGADLDGALEAAASNGHERVAKLLLEKGAVFNAQTLLRRNDSTDSQS